MSRINSPAANLVAATLDWMVPLESPASRIAFDIILAADVVSSHSMYSLCALLSCMLLWFCYFA